MIDQIHKTVREIPLYRQLYGESVSNFDLQKNYQNYPSIEKRDVAKGFPNNWMSSALKLALESKQVELNASSGTTSERMQIVRKPGWWNEENYRTYQYDDKLRRVNTPEHRKAVLSTAICSNTVCFTSLPSFEQRIMGQTLYLNILPDPNNWQKADAERITEEINRYQPHILDVDPIYLAIFLKLREQHNITTPLFQPEVIIYTYEYVTRFARNFCTTHFPNIPSMVFYGSTETGYNLFETPKGDFIHVPDRCYLDFEVIERDICALKITSWKNEYMPLINYRIGDLARIEPDHQIPTHQRAGSLLRVKQMCGRMFDAVRNSKDKLVTVGDIERAFENTEGDALFYQLRFITPTNCLFRYVTRSGEPLADFQQKSFEEKIRELFTNEVQIQTLHEKTISPEVSGKFSILKKS